MESDGFFSEKAILSCACSILRVSECAPYHWKERVRTGKFAACIFKHQRKNAQKLANLPRTISSLSRLGLTRYRETNLSPYYTPHKINLQLKIIYPSAVFTNKNMQELISAYSWALCQSCLAVGVPAIRWSIFRWPGNGVILNQAFIRFPKETCANGMKILCYK